jgi:ribose-phosphate pyrophosphokinase
VARKQRLGDRDVNVTLPAADFQGRHVVLVDDIVSTGRTLEAASRQLISHQPASITVMVTHALFVGDAQQRIRSAGADEIWSCDSVVHATNRIGLARSIAAALVDL